MSHRAGHRAGNSVNKTSSNSQVAVPHEVEAGGRYRIRTYDFHRVKLTVNGKQRTSEESSVIPSSVNRALGAPSNENCAQICTQIFRR
jgi:hypothetical protein